MRFSLGDKIDLRWLVLISLLMFIAVSEGIQTYFIFYPKAIPIVQGFTDEQLQEREGNTLLLKKLGALTTLDNGQEAFIFTVNDVDSLKKSSQFNAQVYKNSVNGDRVVGFPSRVIVYRESENKIIYDGASPAVLQESAYRKELEVLLPEVAKKVFVDPAVLPQLLTVLDPDTVKKQNPLLYKDVIKGDKVLLYTDRVIIYRPGTGKIIYDGKISK